MTFSYHARMAKRAVKKTISLPADLARELQRQAAAEQKTISGLIQDALAMVRRARLKEELKQIQGYWSARAREKGILTEQDLERYLNE